MLPKVEVTCRMLHDGEVNRARHCPHNDFLIATKGPKGDVYVYDYSAHPSRPPEDAGGPAPQLVLKGHTKEGYGLAWSSLEEGRIASGSDDSLVLMWDTRGRVGRGAEMTPTREFKGHESVVEDVSWHYFSRDLLASVGDDRRLVLWDARQSSPVHRVLAHTSEVNCIDFNPFQEFLLATGGADRVSVSELVCSCSCVPVVVFESVSSCVRAADCCPLGHPQPQRSPPLARGPHGRRLCRALGAFQRVRPRHFSPGPSSGRVGPVSHRAGTNPGGCQGWPPRAALHPRGPHWQDL
jgi:WD40 repeat protein